MTYTIKKYEARHLRSCAELMRDTWNFHEGFENIPDPILIYIAYVRTCADYSLHLEVITDESEKIHGVLFGSIEEASAKERFLIWRRCLKTSLWANTKWLFGKFGNRRIALVKFKSLANINAAGEKYADRFDSEINLLAVSHELRGKGYGYKLMNNYMDFCRKNALKTTFLWTELSCTYSFYEKYGFTRFDTFHHQDLTAGNMAADNGFVYCMEVPPKANCREDIHFEDITDANRITVLSLKVSEEQKGHIESVKDCLHDAATDAYNTKWQTVAIYAKDTAVGFAMYGISSEGQVWLDRLMIDAEYQGKGYGKSALRLLIDRLSAEYNCDKIYLSVFGNNTSAIALYENFGFRFNGEKDVNGEKVMVRKAAKGKANRGGLSKC